MAKRDQDRREIEREDASVLPEREAMSIISPGNTAGIVPDLGALPDAGDAVSDAQASASGEESVTSDDRIEHFESTDTAASET
jgi:hypothetical protein